MMTARHRSKAHILVTMTASMFAWLACSSDVDTDGNSTTSSSSSSSGTTSSSSSSSSGGGPPSCAEACADLVGAGCSDGPASIDDCTAGCEATAVLCPHEIDTVFACAGSEATISCLDGEPVPEGCEAEQAAAKACLNAKQQVCMASCPAVVAAGCSKGPQDVADCERGCRAATIDCPTEMQKVLACAGKSPTFSCDINDTPVPEGCDTAQQALLGCLNSQ